MRIHYSGHLACPRDLGQRCPHHDRCARFARRRLCGIRGSRPVSPAQTEQEREREQLAEEALAAPTIEEQRQTFITDHALTPREVDVLIAVTQDERPLKQVAEELGISMRMVQRHLSSIYQKTDTQTRAGLTKAFPSA